MRISKFLLSAAAVAAAMAVFSCVKVEETVRVESISFGASFSQEDHKTILDETGFKVLWEGSDQIAVSGGTDPFVIEPAIAEPLAAVRFKGEAAVADIYYGAYPFSALKAWNGSTATMSLQQIQPARKGSFASDLNISVSSTDAATRNFQFHNVLGYLKFTIGENTGDVTEFVVSSIGGEKLSGKFTVDCSSETPELVADSYANTSAAISSEQPLAPGDYYLALFPGTYADGLKFIVKGPNGVATKALNQELTLQRGKVNTLGTINVTNWIKSVEKSTELSTMSFNVRNKEVFEKEGMADYENEFTHWDNRKAAIASMIADIQPDLLGVQEPSESQLNEMKTLLAGYTWEGTLPGTDLGDILGKTALLNGMFYRTDKFDFVSSGTWYYGSSDGSHSGQNPLSDLYRRYFQWAKLTHKQSGETVWLFNTHLPTNGEDEEGTLRTQCMQELISKIRELVSENEVLYITGDFNCGYSDDRGKSILAVVEGYLFDARTETEDRDNWYTFNNWANHTVNGLASIDHIFYRNVTPVQYRTIVSDKYGLEFLSDHFAINFKSTVRWEVPVGPVFDAAFAEGFDIVKLEADLGEGFKDEDDYGNGNMEGFGPEDSFEFE